MFLPKVQFQSHRTQQLYNLLKSVQVQLKPIINPNNKQSQQQNLPHRATLDNDHHISSRQKQKLRSEFNGKWTVQSSKSKDSHSISLESKHPYTSRAYHQNARLYFKSSKFNYNTTHTHMKIVDLNTSHDQSIGERLNRSTQTIKRSNKANNKIKSKIFTKSQLEKIKKTMHLVNPYDIYT